MINPVMLRGACLAALFAVGPAFAQEVVAPVTSQAAADDEDTLRFTAWPLFYREERPGSWVTLPGWTGAALETMPFVDFIRLHWPHMPIAAPTMKGDAK